MTKSDTVSIREVYELIDKRMVEVTAAFGAFKREEFCPLQKQVELNEKKIDRLWVYVTLGAGVATMVFELVAKRIVEAFTQP
jgi:hypothetical protein